MNARASKYNNNKTKYTITAVIVIISKFAPSGSLIRTNSTLEQRIDIIPKIIRNDFFGLKFMNCFAARLGLEPR